MAMFANLNATYSALKFTLSENHVTYVKKYFQQLQPKKAAYLTAYG